MGSTDAPATGGGVRSSDPTWDKVWRNDDNTVFGSRAAAEGSGDDDDKDLTPEQLGELDTGAGPAESEDACDKLNKSKRGLGSLAALANALARDPMNCLGN